MTPEQISLVLNFVVITTNRSVDDGKGMDGVQNTRLTLSKCNITHR